MARHVRKGDLVFVTTGNARGKQGKVLNVNPKRQQVIIEGLNLRKKHVKPTQANPQGGIVEKEGTIHISNLKLICHLNITLTELTISIDTFK